MIRSDQLHTRMVPLTVDSGIEFNSRTMTAIVPHDASIGLEVLAAACGWKVKRRSTKQTTRKKK